MTVRGRYRIQGRGATDISASIETGVRSGALPPGAQLPPVRSLAGELAVSPATVAAGYRLLRDRGVVATDGRRGTRVASRPPLPVRGSGPVPPGLVDLASGQPDPDLLPELPTALAGLGSLATGYPEQPVLPQLAVLAHDRLAAEHVPAVSLTVVGGALDGIERVLTARLRPGDRVAAEDPGYPPLLDLLAALNHPVEPVALDDQGMSPDGLAQALHRGSRAMLVSPRAHNPTGAALGPTRARALRRLLAEYPDVLLIEDDHAADVAGAPLHTLCGARRAAWAHVRSVSKSLGPDLRLAILAGDPTTIARVEGRRALGTGWVSYLLQRIVVALWTDPALPTVLEVATQAYRARRQALRDALRERGITARGESGLTVWVPVPDEHDALSALARAGFAASPGQRYRLASPPGVRISISRLDPAAASRVADALRAAAVPALRPFQP